MKVVLLSATMLVLSMFSSALLQSQTLSSEKVQAYLASQTGTPKSMPAIGESRKVYLLTPQVPTTFTRLIKDDSGDVQLGTNICLGGAYVFMIGDATLMGAGNYRVDPEFFVGLGIEAGIGEEVDGEMGVLSLNVILGFSSIALSLGYDFLIERPVLALGTQIDFLDITDDGTNIIGGL